MKKRILLVLILFLAPLSRAQITIVQSGHAVGGAVSTTAAYNQAATHTMFVFASAYGTILTGNISDTAGNTFTPVFTAGDFVITANNVHVQAWTVFGCLGNAANVVTISTMGNDFGSGGISVYDITGVTALDFKANGASGSEAITFSSAHANEAIVSLVVNFQNFLSGGNTPPATSPTYTLDPSGPLTGFIVGATKVVSTLLTTVTETWTTANSAYDQVFTFGLTAAAAVNPSQPVVFVTEYLGYERQNERRRDSGCPSRRGGCLGNNEDREKFREDWQRSADSRLRRLSRSTRAVLEEGRAAVEDG
jgi:hypothetical protein